MTEQKDKLMNRRDFIVNSAAVGALIMPVSLLHSAPKEADLRGSKQLNAFVILEPSNRVTVLTPFVEMGQGVHTAIPMLVAEELDIPLEQISLKESPLGPNYRLHFGGAMRYTGSSLTIADAFIPFRQAGANARSLLLDSASLRWSIPTAELFTNKGQIKHASSGKTVCYGELLPIPDELQIPGHAKLKQTSQFNVIGKALGRLDAKDKSNGSAKFGIDIAPPEALIATVRQSPVFGGRVISIDDDVAAGMDGVIGIEIIPNGTYSIRDYAMAPPDKVPDEILGSVAIIADTFWHATEAMKELKVVYEGGAKHFSSDAFSEKLRTRVTERGVPVESTGAFIDAFSGSQTSISATYEVPFLAHATIEPMNCTVLAEGEHCKVWTGNQDAEWIARIAAKILQIPIDNVSVFTPYIGGSFGRRSNNDYAIQAISLAKKVPGRPIKLVWTREEDLQHDFYRPNVVAFFQCGFDTNQDPIAFRQLNIGDGGQRQQGMAEHLTFDPSLMDSSTQQPYNIPNKSLEYLLEKIPIPVGFWRSVGGAHNGFFIESFMDEMAHSVKEDPASFRRRLLSNSPRFLAVLDLALKMANWRSEVWVADDGTQHAMGLALHEDHHTIVAEIADVSVNGDGLPQVHHVWCAADCGVVLNPGIGAMQIESAIALGLSAALMEKVEFKDGQVTNKNFDDYPILTASQMPTVSVKFIDSDAMPTGLGEPGTPPIAAALCNALYTLTGKRIRTLPVGRLIA